MGKKSAKKGVFLGKKVSNGKPNIYDISLYIPDNLTNRDISSDQKTHSNEIDMKSEGFLWIYLVRLWDNHRIRVKSES